jgi:spore germination cell wall hydrolase CwlJ-like protein
VYGLQQAVHHYRTKGNRERDGLGGGKEMKNVLSISCVVVMTVFVLIAGIGSYNAHDYTVHTKPREFEKVKEIPAPRLSYPKDEINKILLDDGDPDSDIPLLRDKSFVKLTEEEIELLESIAMAEAEGEDTKGKALVMRVVLNRSLKREMSIEEVIFEPNQFATKRMGIEPSENCHEAMAMIVDGWDESDGALYFNNQGYSYGEPLFKYGGHYFSK